MSAKEKNSSTTHFQDFRNSTSPLDFESAKCLKAANIPNPYGLILV